METPAAADFRPEALPLDALAGVVLSGPHGGLDLDGAEALGLDGGPLDRPHWHDPEYVPTASEIEAACLEIQATWSERERRRRAGLALGRYTIPRVSAGGRCPEPAE